MTSSVLIPEELEKLSAYDQGKSPYSTIQLFPRPTVQCFAPSQYNQFKKNTILQHSFDVGPNLSDPFTRDHLLIQQREADALYKTQFEVCARTMGDNLKYMGTSTVSRDIDFITTALEGDDALM